MAVYAIGDIQGCFDELQAALDSIAFDPQKDQLWFVGDLVNRGPKSLEVLRYIKNLGNAAISVLGNHDLHLLAMAFNKKKQGSKDTLKTVLKAPDAEELLHWLRHRPLMHYSKALNFVMIHAGLPPQWDITTAAQCAREVEAVLQGKNYRKYFKHMYGDLPDLWDDSLTGMDRHRFITNCFTRLRFCDLNGRLAVDQKGPPCKKTRAKYVPWFEAKNRKSRETQIVFGHWSTLGYYQANKTWAIDSGCLWGGNLTLLRIDLPHPKAIHFPCQAQQDPNLFI